MPILLNLIHFRVKAIEFLAVSMLTIIDRLVDGRTLTDAPWHRGRYQLHHVTGTGAQEMAKEGIKRPAYLAEYKAIFSKSDKATLILDR